MATNCYLLFDLQLRCVAIIDPGAYSAQIENYMAEHDLELKYILITHGHFDHVGGLSQFHTRYPDVPIVMANEDAELYKHAPLMAQSFGFNLLQQGYLRYDPEFFMDYGQFGH